MKSARYCSLCFIFLLVFSCALAAEESPKPAPVPRDQCIGAMLNAAKRKDMESLEKYVREHQEQIKKDKLLNYARALAYYMIDPEKQESAYVEAFPVDDTVMDIYEYIVVQPQPSSWNWIAYTALEEIALKGNAKAINKTFAASLPSDGVVGEGFSDTIWKLLEKYPDKSLDALAALPEKDRKTIYICTGSVTDAEGFAEMAQSLKSRKDKFTKKQQEIIEEMVAFKDFPWARGTTGN